MNKNLKSSSWMDAAIRIKKCHLSILTGGVEANVWHDAFTSLVTSIKDERRFNDSFAKDLSDLTEDTGFDYDFRDILEEYFDHLEESNEWQLVIDSAKDIISLFSWEKMSPSEYKYRIGNALDKLGRTNEALEFGKTWLSEWPNDYYAAASNVFLLISLGKIDEAEKITEKYLSKDLVCTRKTDTFFMAAMRLYEITEDSYAKERIAEKIREYNEQTLKIEE